MRSSPPSRDRYTSPTCCQHSSAVRPAGQCRGPQRACAWLRAGRRGPGRRVGAWQRALAEARTGAKRSADTSMARLGTQGRPPGAHRSGTSRIRSSGGCLRAAEPAAPGLETVIVTGWAAPAQPPAHSGPAITDWRALPQPATSVIPGMAGKRVQFTRVDQPVHRQRDQAGRPPRPAVRPNQSTRVLVGNERRDSSDTDHRPTVMCAVPAAPPGAGPEAAVAAGAGILKAVGALPAVCLRSAQSGTGRAPARPWRQ